MSLSSSNEITTTNSHQEQSSYNRVDGILRLWRTFFAKVDEVGLTLKARAINAQENADIRKETDPLLWITFGIQASVLYSCFILYRAYRGFFVILPAVFRSVYRKLEAAMEEGPFDGKNPPALKGGSIAMVEEEYPPQNERVRLRVAIVVTTLAFAVTCSYAVTGAYRVVSKFIGNLIRTKSVHHSIGAAADTVLENEIKMMDYSNKNQTAGGTVQSELKP